MTEIPDAAVLMSMVKSAGAGFTDNKWDELLALIDSQAEAIQRVRELHKPFTRKVSELWSNAGELETLCRACEVQSDAAFYPCPTIKKLDGKNE